MFTPRCIAAMQAHAVAAFPHESCGVVVRGRYVPLVNRHADPANHFLISDDDYRRHAGRLQAVVHSHPWRAGDPESDRIPPWPSLADMEGQLATAVPWVIIPTDGAVAGQPVVWGDGAPVPPLKGRPFVHGVTDCYSLIRDYYRLELGIALPEKAREKGWWDPEGRAENLYLENYRRAGFAPVAPEAARVHDVVLLTVLSPVHNHGGVVRPGGLILHHLEDRLSREEPLGRWLRMNPLFLRHAALAGGERGDA
ncbi:Phage tail assembly protein [Azospirillum argentinense]|uniref:NlpC/P60 family protein n=1 Tax=Azospirillum argentinense TaxID=2970906 RepID=UPI0032DEBAFF